MRKLNIKQANHGDIVAVNIDKNIVGYIESEFNKWVQTVQNPSDISLGGKLFKMYLVNNTNNQEEI